MQDIEKEYKSRSNNIIYVLGIVFIIMFFYAIFSAVLIIIISDNIQSINPWALALGQILFLFIPAIFAIKPLRIDWRYFFRLNFPGIKYIFLASLGVLFIEIFSQSCIALQGFIIPNSWMSIYQRLIDDYTNTMKGIISGTDIWAVFRSIIVVAIVPAVAEESLFRGFLQTSLEYTTKSSYAIVFSAFLFAAMHLNPVIFLSLWVAGAFFGFAAYAGSSIIVPVILHFLLNFMGVMSFIFADHTDNFDLGSTSIFSVLLLFLFSVAGIVFICYRLLKMKEIPKTNPQSSNLDGE